jgi:hypothetical protein
MVELKIYLSNSLNEKFRKAAMNAFGYGRGSLSKAAEEALTEWCKEHEGPLTQPRGTESGHSPADTMESGVNPDERQSSADGAAALSESAPIGSTKEIR